MNLSALDPLVLAGLGAVVAYFIGSLSFAVIVSRLFGLADPRSYGSGNPGATNVLRSGNKAAAILTLLFDALKGYVPVAVAWRLGPDSWKWPEERVAEKLEGLRFGPRETGPRGPRWSVTLPDGYEARALEISRTQMARGGARLAELLNAIWP